MRWMQHKLLLMAHWLADHRMKSFHGRERDLIFLMEHPNQMVLLFETGISLQLFSTKVIRSAQAQVRLNIARLISSKQIASCFAVTRCALVSKT